MILNRLLGRFLKRSNRHLDTDPNSKLQVFSSVEGNVLPVALTESDRDLALKIMINEVADLTKAMREFLMTIDRFINFAGLVGAAVITYGILNDDETGRKVVRAFAFYGLVIVSTYLLQVFTEVEKRAGYKAYLELEINKQFKRPILLESSVNKHSNRNRPSVVMLSILNFLPLVGLGYASWQATSEYKDPVVQLWESIRWRWVRSIFEWLSWRHINSVLLVFAAATLLVAVWELNTASGKATRTAAKESAQLRIVPRS